MGTAEYGLPLTDFRIVNAPGAAIWSNAALGGAGSSKIENNTIVNPARSSRLSEDKGSTSELRSALRISA